MSLYQVLRSRVVKAPLAVQQDLRGKVAIVTGCAPNSIGFETAKALADWGATVVITTRSNVGNTVQALRAVVRDGDAIDGHILDVTDTHAVVAFAAWFEKTHGGQLDILVNNAGVHLDLLSQWKEPQLSGDGFEIQWRTNYLGVMHLTYLLLPLLKATAQKKGGARIVNVSSQMHSKGYNAGLLDAYPYNSWTAYGMSKLAIVHATFECQRRLAADRVQAYCLHPGAVFTNIADKGLAGNGWLQALRHALAPVERFTLLTPSEGAQTSLHCATHPEAVGGQYYQQCRPRAACADSADAAVAARLWDETEQWVRSIS